MLNIMLIDDEAIVLNGMVAMLKAQCDVKLNVISFLDSVEALETLPSLHIDVVITDINMPELDGLSFIEQAMRCGYQGQFLIISGYEELEYYKRAISYHVVDYLMKPIDKAMLYKHLRQLNEDKQQAVQTLLYRLVLCLDGGFVPNDSTLGIQASGLQRLLPNADTALVVMREIANNGFSAFINALYALGWNVYVISYGCFQILLCNFAQKTEKIELVRIWKESAGLAPIALGMSPSQPSEEFFAALSQGYGINLLLNVFADLVMQELLLEPALTSACDCYSLTFRYADALVRKQDAAVLRKECDQLIVGCHDNELAFTKAFLEVVAMMEIQLRMALSPETLRTFYAHKRSEATDDRSLRITLQTLLKSYLQCTEDWHTSKSCYSEKVEQALLYLKRHYHEEISLYTVSVHIGSNPSYLSALFSKEVGETFLNYLHKLRMEAACDLLENYPAITTETISQRVGYQTIGNFYRIFKSRYGVSPSKWRNIRQSAASGGRG
jgi:two-component system, response regulator YesN